MVDDRHLSREEIRTWVDRQLTTAPERSEVWGEQIISTYLGEARPGNDVAA